MDVAIVVALITGALSLTGVLLNVSNVRRQDRDKRVDEQRRIAENKPESLQAMLQTAHEQLGICYADYDELRIRYREACEQIDALMGENRTLRREREEAHLKILQLERDKS